LADKVYTYVTLIGPEVTLTSVSLMLPDPVVAVFVMPAIPDRLHAKVVPLVILPGE
jgi:hypothetical protein